MDHRIETGARKLPDVVASATKNCRNDSRVKTIQGAAVTKGLSESSDARRDMLQTRKVSIEELAIIKAQLKKWVRGGKKGNRDNKQMVVNDIIRYLEGSDSREFNFKGKGLTGIPQAICRLRDIRYLDLSENSITELPDDFGNIGSQSCNESDPCIINLKENPFTEKHKDRLMKIQQENTHLKIMYDSDKMDTDKQSSDHSEASDDEQLGAVGPATNHQMAMEPQRSGVGNNSETSGMLPKRTVPASVGNSPEETAAFRQKMRIFWNIGHQALAKCRENKTYSGGDIQDNIEAIVEGVHVTPGLIRFIDLALQKTQYTHCRGRLQIALIVLNQLDQMRHIPEERKMILAEALEQVCQNPMVFPLSLNKLACTVESLNPAIDFESLSKIKLAEANLEALDRVKVNGVNNDNTEVALQLRRQFRILLNLPLFAENGRLSLSGGETYQGDVLSKQAIDINININEGLVNDIYEAIWPAVGSKERQMSILIKSKIWKEKALEYSERNKPEDFRQFQEIRNRGVSENENQKACLTLMVKVAEGMLKPLPQGRVLTPGSRR